MAEAVAPRCAARVADIPRFWAQHAPEAPPLFEDDRPVSFAVLARPLEGESPKIRLVNSTHYQNADKND